METSRKVCSKSLKVCLWNFFTLTTAAEHKLQCIRDATLHFKILHIMRQWNVLSVYSDHYCHNKTVTPSINGLLVSHPRRRFGGESGDRVSSRVSPLCSSSYLSRALSARHVDARLFGLKVLYLSSPPWQPAALVSGSAHIRPPLSCLTCLALKDDPQLVCQCQHTTSEEWTLTTAAEGWEEDGRGGRGRVARKSINLFVAMSPFMWFSAVYLHFEI